MSVVMLALALLMLVLTWLSACPAGPSRQMNMCSALASMMAILCFGRASDAVGPWVWVDTASCVLFTAVALIGFARLTPSDASPGPQVTLAEEPSTSMPAIR